MSAFTTDDPGWAKRRGPAPTWSQRLPRVERLADPSPPTTLTYLFSWAFSVLSLILLVLVLNVTLVSQLQHFSAQHRLYQQLRTTLAEGSTPIGQLDVNQHLTAPGTPLALLQIPELGIKEVIVEGATSEQTKIGIGHRPDTVLPGQPGNAILMGRASAYGGVFGNIDKLAVGDTFTVTTGQGKSTYKVSGATTKEKVELPGLTGSAGRLTMYTAGGSAFFPSGAVRVFADLISPPYASPGVAIAAGSFKDSEKPLAGDASRVVGLSWLLQLLLVAAVAGVWAWKRWSRQAVLIVFVPVVAAIGLTVADRITDLLPNLM